MLRLEDAEFQGHLRLGDSRTAIWTTFLKAVPAATVLEVGVWKGVFAKALMQECGSIQKYYMLDPWATLPDWNKPFNVGPEMFDAVYEEAMRNTEFAAAKRIVLRGRTKEVISAIPDNSLDFAYIDGDHTLRGITIDLMKVLPKIREGGFIGGDDFSRTPWMHDVKYEPTLVCPYVVYFAESMDLPIVALNCGQFLIQKRTDAQFAFVDLTGEYSDLSLNKHLIRERTSVAVRIRDRVRALLPRIVSGNNF